MEGEGGEGEEKEEKEKVRRIKEKGKKKKKGRKRGFWVVYKFKDTRPILRYSRLCAHGTAEKVMA